MPSTSAVRVTAGVVGVLALGLAVALKPGGGGSGGPAPEPSGGGRATAPPPATEPPQAVPPARVAGFSFSDITTEVGLGAPQAERHLVGSEIQTGGAAVADFDDDGDDDIFLTRVGAPNLLYRNDGAGGFDEVAEALGVAGDRPEDGAAGALFADVDGDGWLDLLVIGSGQAGLDLYVNDGRGAFSEQGAERGLRLPAEPEVPANTYSAAFSDWDRDGDLDLFVLHWYLDWVPPGDTDGAATNDDRASLCEQAAAVRASGSVADGSRSRLFNNDGGGRFSDATELVGTDLNQVAGFTPTFADVDGDGWEDLLIAGDFCTSRLLLNREGAGFEDVTDSAGVGTDENGMGSVVEDLDGDGNLDWFVTSIAYPTAEGGCPIPAPTVGCSGNRLYLGDGAGAFVDATDRFGVRDGFWGWGAAAEDFDLDGERDLMMVNGYRSSPSDVASGEPNEALYRRMDGDPNRFWLGSGPGPWPEVSEAIGLTDRANGKALVPFDLEGDGDLDLLIANNEGPPLLYRNDLDVTERHWLAIRLRQDGANSRAVGARVRVTGPSGRAQVLDVRAGGSFQSGDPYDLHTGLGADSAELTVEVWWPGEPEPQVVTGVDADQVLELTRATDPGSAG